MYDTSSVARGRSVVGMREGLSWVLEPTGDAEVLSIRGVLSSSGVTAFGPSMPAAAAAAAIPVLLLLRHDDTKVAAAVLPPVLMDMAGECWERTAVGWLDG